MERLYYCISHSRSLLFSPGCNLRLGRYVFLGLSRFQKLGCFLPVVHIFIDLGKPSLRSGHRALTFLHFLRLRCLPNISRTNIRCIHCTLTFLNFLQLGYALRIGVSRHRQLGLGDHRIRTRVARLHVQRSRPATSVFLCGIPPPSLSFREIIEIYSF